MRLKMVHKLQDKNKQAMFGKTHYEDTFKLISEPGQLNLWSKIQLINYKNISNKMSRSKMSKYLGFKW